MKRYKTIALAVIAVLVLMAGSAFAATVTDTFTVQVGVAAAYTISSTTVMDFGTYDPTSAVNDDDGTATLTYRCTKATTTDTYITGVRTMVVVDTLNFDLYTDAARTIAFPSAAGSGDTNNTSVSAVADITRTIYGRIAALQDVGVSAAYTRDLTVTVEY
jgi:spore coat protein U-like protein